MTMDDNSKVEVQRLRRLLRSLTEMAESASVSGSLSGGVTTAVRKYNAILQRLEALGVLLPGLFQPLAEEASFDEVGVETGLLADYLKDLERDEDERRQSRDEERSQREEERSRSRGAAGHSIFSPTVSLGFKDLKDLNDFRELGRMFRDQFPAWVRAQAWAECSSTESEADSLSDVESRLAVVSGQLQMVAEQLQRMDLSDTLRAEMAEQLSRLGQEQAKLARRRATLREQQQQ